MVRLEIYGVATAIAITTFALSIASLLQPSWITFHTPVESPLVVHTTYGLFRLCTSSHIHWAPGSDHDEAGSVTCRRFPTRSQDCKNSMLGRLDPVDTDVVSARTGGGVEAGQARPRLGKGKKQAGDDDDDGDDDDETWSFCDSWVTAGYATQLSLIFGCTSILASFVIALSGRQKRESGWRVVSGLMSVHAACLIVAMALVAYEFNHDERFYTGSRLGKGFIMATTAWCLDVVVVIALIAVGAVGLVRDDDYQPISDS